MDIALIRTFLEVASTGSFMHASSRLFVTQSAVSLRVQRLEDALGKTLFHRSKAGAELTAAGREFERYALSMIKIWEEARQQIALPKGYTKSLSVAAQYSLWPRLGFQWLDAMRAENPELSIRAELGMPDRITRFLIEGVAQVGLSYSPQLRPGLSAQKVIDEELVLAASFPGTISEIQPHYVYVDWGPEFLHALALELPTLSNSGLALSLGAMAAEFVAGRKAAAYLPASHIKGFLDDERLFLVPDAPAFAYPVWSVWRDDLDPETRRLAETKLKRVAHRISNEQDQIMDELAEMSDS